MPARADAGASRGRLIFALDATASRERDLGSGLRRAGRDVPGGGAAGRARRAARLLSRLRRVPGQPLGAGQPAELVRLMQAVRCVAGRTQIDRVLRHAAQRDPEASASRRWCSSATAWRRVSTSWASSRASWALRGVRAFLFHEGRDPAAAAPSGRSRSSPGGAYCRFDASSPGPAARASGRRSPPTPPAARAALAGSGPARRRAWSGCGAPAALTRHAGLLGAAAWRSSGPALPGAALVRDRPAAATSPRAATTFARRVQRAGQHRPPASPAASGSRSSPSPPRSWRSAPWCRARRGADPIGEPGETDGDRLARRDHAAGDAA